MEGLAYREHRPVPELARHVQCLWELSGVETHAAPQLIVPDGCMELVINSGAPFEQVLGPDEAQRQPSILLVGEVRRPVTTRATGRVSLLGVRFAHGAAHLVLGQPAHELVDHIPAHDEVMAPELRRALERVRDAAPGERLRLLQGELVRCVRAHKQRGEDVIAQRALRVLVAREGCTSIAELEAELGASRRHLERCFRAAVGVPPKVLARVLRFRRVLRALEDGGGDWAAVALACGYFDQSHLARDFKVFTGSTPGAYLRSEHPLSDLLDGSRGIEARQR